MHSLCTLFTQGGCGACTVMLSHYEDGKVVHRSANACLCPLYAVEGMHVVTVEGGSRGKQAPLRAPILTAVLQHATCPQRGPRTLQTNPASAKP